MQETALINGESHFTASFGGLWAVCGLQIVIVIFTVQTVKLSSCLWAKESVDAGIAGLQ